MLPHHCHNSFCDLGATPAAGLNRIGEVFNLASRNDRSSDFGERLASLPVS